MREVRLQDWPLLDYKSLSLQLIYCLVCILFGFLFVGSVS